MQLAGTNPVAVTSAAAPTPAPQAAVTSPAQTTVAAAVPQAMSVNGGNIVMVSTSLLFSKYFVKYCELSI